MAKPAKFIIDVYPITPLSLKGQQFYSYLWNEKIPAGSLVSIPFYKRNIEGIAINSRTDFHRLGSIELKKVGKVLEEKFLDNNQLKLAEFISDYYFSPIGKVLKLFCPKRTKARSKKQETRNKKDIKKIKLTIKQQAVIKEIASVNLKFKIKNLKFLLYGPASSGKTEVYIHSILKLKEKNADAQFLILLPELTLTPQAIERYGEYFQPEEIAVMHSKISKGQFYSNWQKIKSGEAKIIIGTRMAVFAPFKNLGLIVMDEEQDMSFKQWDMSPRYDARMAAEKLAELHKCPLVFGSATPRVEDYYKAQQKQYILLTLPQLVVSETLQRSVSGTAKIELVDMKKERWAKNYSSISKKLKSEIAYALKNKQQVILFVNKQGMSNFSVCDKCKAVLRCPKCERALVYDNSGIYKCVHCAHKADILAECPKCKGMSFKNIGFGTQKIEREIAGLFPGARIARADSQSMKASGAQEKLYAKFRDGEIDILIGTQMISKGWDLPTMALVGIIDADNLLTIPDFRTSERAFQNILQVSGRAGRLHSKFPGVILVQTFNPESKFFKLLAERNIGEFYEKEIAERKALGLPPFSGIIKLVFQDYAKDKIEKESLRVYGLLSEAIKAPVKSPQSGASKAEFNGVSISEPQDSFVSNIRGRYRKQIIIKIKEDIPVKITEMLRTLPHGWIIDVDPINIL